MTFVPYRVRRPGRNTHRPRVSPIVTAIVLGALAVGVGPRPAAAVVPSRNLDVVGHFNDFPAGIGRYSSCWHYVHGDGREYALIGYQRGIGIYNVTNPFAAYLVDSIPGPNNGWREMKSYRNWIYVVSEANVGAGAGLQIVRMTDPENPVLAATYTITFVSAHTVTVDTTRALLFANGTRTASGQDAGMRILSLANPEAPVEVGRWPSTALPIPLDKYVHDAVVRGTTLYAAAIYGGGIRVLDTTNPAGTYEAVNFGYFNARYVHNSWPDASGTILYVTDETNGMPLGVFDISSYTTPFKLPVYEWTSNPQAVVHNAHVRGNDLWLAHYTEGVWVLDATDPRHPAPFAYADTYAGPSGGFRGVWGVDPFLPSGLGIASDMATGLYLLQPQRNYGIVRVAVTDAATGEPMDSVMVHCTTQSDSLETTFRGDGIVAFAPSPGIHTFQVRHFGFDPVTQTVAVKQGSTQTLSVALVRKPTAMLTGVVRDAVTLAVLPEAEVDLLYTPVHAHTEAGGDFTLEDVPDDDYVVAVRRPGYIPLQFQRRIGPGFDGSQDFELKAAATWDNLSTGAGWSVLAAAGESHLAGSGRWMRVEPYGTTTGIPDDEDLLARPAPSTLAWRGRATPLHDDAEGSGATAGQCQPNVDRSPAPDSLCFVTGNDTSVPNSVIDRADVDSTTTLTSAAYDLTGMATPMLGVWAWFYSQFRHPDDFLAISISNDDGASWAPLDTLRGDRNHWTEYDYRVADHVTPTNHVRLRFVAVDGGEPSVVECAVDDVVAYDQATAPAAVLGGRVPPALRFAAVWPNPAPRGVRLTLVLPGPGPVEVDVIDVTGRHVAALHRGVAHERTLALAWDGTAVGGAAAPAGLYFARARTLAGTAQCRFVRVR